MTTTSSSTNEILQEFCSRIRLHADDDELLDQVFDEIADFLIQGWGGKTLSPKNEEKEDSVKSSKPDEEQDTDIDFPTDPLQLEDATPEHLHFLTTIALVIEQIPKARKELARSVYGKRGYEDKKLLNMMKTIANMLEDKEEEYLKSVKDENLKSKRIYDLTERQILCFRDIALFILLVTKSTESIDKYFKTIFNELSSNPQIDLLNQALNDFILVLTEIHFEKDCWDPDKHKTVVSADGRIRWGENTSKYFHRKSDSGLIFRETYSDSILNYLEWWFNELQKIISSDIYNNPTIRDHQFFKFVANIAAKSLPHNIGQARKPYSLWHAQHSFSYVWGQWLLKMNSMISPTLLKTYYFKVLQYGQLMETTVLCDLLEEICQLHATSCNLQQTKLFSSNGLVLVTDVVLALKSPHIVNKLADSQILKHHFFQLIQDIFHKLCSKLYSNWKTLTTEEIDCLSAISSLIYHMLPHFESTHKDYLNRLLFQSSPIDQLCQTIQDLSKNEYEPDNIQYKYIGSLIQMYGRCYYTPLVNEFRNQLELLLKPIAECIRSIFYLKAIQKWSWDERSRFYIQNCPVYIIHYSQKRQATISDNLCSRILVYSEQIFDQQLEKILDVSSDIESITFHVELLNFLAMFPSSRKLFTKHTSIIDTLIIILNSYNTYAKKFGHKLIGLCSILLYNLTFDKILFSVIKSKNFTLIFDQLSDVSDDSIQFGIRSLKNMLDKKSIDQDDKTSAAAAAEAYTEILSKAVEDPSQISHGVSLPTILNSMKTLTQNEYVTKEIVSQEKSLELLTKCASDKKFDTQQVQKPALETIRIITFEPESKGPLEQNTVFIEHVKILIVSANDPIIQKVANGIMWNMENQQKFIDAQDATHRTVKKKVNGVETIAQEPIIRSIEFKYDIMVSYCHKNKDLCHKIYDRLQVDYKVWIDKEGMYGSTIEAMAEAIENSSVFLLCMSDAYRKSDDCRAEAMYARKRKQRFLPIKVERKYEPSGWLGFIVEDKMYIDFEKLDFHVAYVELKRHLDNSLSRDIRAGRKTASKVYYEKPSLTDWTQEDVNKFFTDHRMEQAATAFAGFDGPRLVELYREYSKQSQNQILDWIKRTPLAQLSMLDFHRIHDELSAFIPQSEKVEGTKKCAIS